MSKKNKNEACAEKGTKSKKKLITRIVALSLVAAFVLCAGIWAIVAFTKNTVRNELGQDYASVMYEVKNGEKYSLDSPYDGLEIFGRLNWKFKQQTKWYAEVHGIVKTLAGDQDVQTYKQYDNGIMISADITKSSMVNVARQFCYNTELDRVVWREDDPKNKAAWNGLDTVFPDVEPSGIMAIVGKDEEEAKKSFKALNGLPATELSVYIFRENTILNCEPVVKNDDGTFSIIYHLNPELIKTEDGKTEGATAYYGNQMVFTGGIDAPPTFKNITVEYTFNEDFEALRSETREQYSATMKTIISSCDSTMVTDYEYNTDKANYKDYDYFKKYIDDGSISKPQEKELTAMECLASAFAGLLTGPAVLDADIKINETPVDGNIYVDLNFTKALGDMSKILQVMELRADLGRVKVWLDAGTVYLKVGDLKIKANIEDVKGIVSTVNEIIPDKSQGESETRPAAPQENEAQPSEGEESTDMLSSLMEAPVVYDKENGTASIHWELAISGLTLPIDFYFDVPDVKHITLDKVVINAAVMDATIGAQIKFDELSNAPEEIGDKTQFIDLPAYVPVITDILKAGYVKAEVGYEYTTEGNKKLAIGGEATVGFGNFDKLTVHADLNIKFESLEQPVAIDYLGDGMIYLTIGEVKVKTNINSAVAVIISFLPGDAAEAVAEASLNGAILLDENGSAEDADADNAGEDGSTFSLAKLLDKILALDFDSLVKVSEEGEALDIGVSSTELLKLFGVDFALGNVGLKLDKQNKAIDVSLDKLAVNAKISCGEAFDTIDITQYADLTQVIELLPEYVPVFMDMFSNDYIDAIFNYTHNVGEEELVVSGIVNINIKSDIKIAATVTVKYGSISLPVRVDYLGDGKVYIALDDMRVCADAERTLEVIELLVGAKSEKAASAIALADADDDLGGSLLELFDGAFKISKTGSRLVVYVKATELLERFDVDLALGDIEFTVNSETKTALIDFKTNDFRIALSKGFAPADIETSAYSDITDIIEVVPEYVEVVKNILSTGVIKAELSFAQDDLTLSGTLSFDIEKLAATGAFDASYGGKTVRISVDYLNDGYIYLALGDAKVKAKIEETIDAVKQLLANDETEITATENAEQPQTELMANIETELLTLTKEENRLVLTADLSALLGKFGISLDIGNLDIGNIELSLNKGEKEFIGVNPAKYNATASITSGEKFEAIEPDDYTDLTEVIKAIPEYVPVVEDILSTKNIKAEIEYSYTLDGTELKLSGPVTINLSDTSNITAHGEITVVYGEKLNKKLIVDYADGNVYLALDDIRVTTVVDRTIKAIEALLAKDEPAAATALTAAEIDGDLSNKLLDVRDGLLTITKEENRLVLFVKATELLNLFEVELDLGNVEIALDKQNNSVALSLIKYGANITVTKGDEFAPVQKELYTDITEVIELLPEYVPVFRKMLEDGVIEANVNFAYTVNETELKISGVVTADFGDKSKIAVHGEFEVAYGDIAKTIFIDYMSDGYIYLALDDIKVKAEIGQSVEAIKALIAELKAEPQAESAIALVAETLTDEILNVKSGLLTITTSEDSFTIFVKATELLKEFDVDFKLGDVTITASKEGKIDVKLENLLDKFGLTASITSGEKFEAIEPDDYTDLTEVIKAIPEYVPVVEDILSTKNVKAEIEYSYTLDGTELKLSGPVTINLSDTSNITAHGEITVVYGEKLNKKLIVDYADGNVYLALDDIRVTTVVDRTIKAIEALLAKDEPAAATALVMADEADGISGKILDAWLKILTVTKEENKLTVLIDSAKLLERFEVELDLGNVEIALDKQSNSVALSLNKYGVKATISKGVAFKPVKTELYTDITEVIELLPEYVPVFRNIMGEGYVKADISFEHEISGKTLSVSGAINLDIRDVKKLAAQVKLDVEYDNIFKTLYIDYISDGNIYLKMDDIRVCAALDKTAQAVKLLVSEISEPETKSAIALVLNEAITDTQNVILNVKSGLLTITKSENSFTLFVKATELLKEFDVDFKLGDLDITVDKTKNEIQVELTRLLDKFDLTAAITKGDALDSITPTEYTDLTKLIEALPDYVPVLRDIVSDKVVTASITYEFAIEEGKALRVTGPLKIDFADEIKLSAELKVEYDKYELPVRVDYYASDDIAYIAATVNGGTIKVKTQLDQVITAITALLPQEPATVMMLAEEGMGASDTLLEVRDLLTVKTEGDVMSIALNVTKILKALELSDIDIGSVDLKVDKKNSTVSADWKKDKHSVSVTASKGEAIEEVNKNEYVDITKVIGLLPEYVPVFADVLSTGSVKADVDYTYTVGDGKTLEVDGEIKAKFKDGIVVTAALKLTYKEAGAEKFTKDVVLDFVNDGKIYIKIDDIRVSAEIEKTISAITELLDKPQTATVASVISEDILKVENLIEIAKDDKKVTFGLYVGEILKGLNIDIGNISIGKVDLIADSEDNSLSLKLDEGGHSVSAKITKVDGVTALSDKDAYTDITDVITAIPEYAPVISDIISTNSIKADVDYTFNIKENEKLNIKGDVTIDFADTSDVKLNAKLGVKYGSIDVPVVLDYSTKKGFAYISVTVKGATIKVTASLDETINAIEALLPKEAAIALAMADGDGALTKTILNVSDMLKVDDKTTSLEIFIDITKALKALKLGDAELGQANIEIVKNPASLSADWTMGEHNVKLKATKGDRVAGIDENLYTDITKVIKVLPRYMPVVLGIFSEGYVDADIDYAYTVSETLSLKLDGKLSLKLDGGVSAHLDINAILLSGGTEKLNKNLTLDFVGDGNLYIAMDDVKVYANIKEAVNAITGMLSTDEAIALAAADLEPTLTEELLKVDELVTVTEQSNSLIFGLQANAILQAFGIDLGKIDLGTVNVTVDSDNNNIVLDVKGAKLTVTKGTEFKEFKSSDYVDVTEVIKVLPEYVPALVEMIKSKNVSANIEYTLKLTDDSELKVSGELKVLFDGTKTEEGIALGADLTITYSQGGAEKISRKLTIEFVNDNYVYITVDELKIKTQIDKTIKVITGLMGGAPAPAAYALASLEPQLKETVKVGSLLEISEENDNLKVAANATKLLEAFGIQLDIGNIDLTLSKNGTIGAAWSKQISGLTHEVKVTVTKSEQTPDKVAKDEYLDVTDVVELVPKIKNIVDTKTVSLCGTLELSLNENNFTVVVNNAVVSLAQDLHVYVDATIKIPGNGTYSKHDVIIDVTKQSLAIVYGEVGIKVFNDANELASLKEEFNKAIARIKEVITYIGTHPEAAPEEIEPQLEAMIATFDLGTQITDVASETASFDWTQLVQDLKIAKSNVVGGFARLTYDNISVDLKKSGGFLGLEADATLDINGTALKLDADFSVREHASFPELPKINYLTKSDIVDLLDYAATAIETIKSQNINLSVNAKIKSDAEKYKDFDGVKNEISVVLNLFTGGEFPIEIVTDEAGAKSFVINPDIFLKLDVDIVAKAANEKSLYIDIIVVDASKSGSGYTTDGELDFYISLSLFKDENDAKSHGATYKPLSLYAPSSELMKILAGGINLLGVKIDLLDEMFVNRWLELDTVDQLQAFGDSIKEMLVGLDFDIRGIVDKINSYNGTVNSVLDVVDKLMTFIKESKSEENVPQAVALLANEPRSGVISELKHTTEDGKSTFTVKVGGVTVTLTKETIEGTPSIGFGISGITSAKADGNQTIELALSLDTKNEVNSENKSSHITIEPTYNFTGISDLILSLTKSAISKQEGESAYGLNKNFYITGNISVQLPIDLGIFSLDIVKVEMRDVKISVNKVEDGYIINLHLKYDGMLGVINGDTTVDITVVLKNSHSPAEILNTGMVYIKRVQTSDFNGGLFGVSEQQITPVTLYRAMPLSSLTNDMLNQLNFILNFSDTISNQIAKSGNGATNEVATLAAEDTATDVPEDYGTLIAKYLTSYKFEEKDDGKTWTVVIDGKSFSKGILDTMTISIGTDKDGIVRDLNVSDTTVNIPVTDLIKIPLTASATLTWHNPCSIMDNGKTDETVTLKDQFENYEHGMGKKLQYLVENNWHDGDKDLMFVEARAADLKLMYNPVRGGSKQSLNETIKNVWISTGAGGDDENCLLSEPIVPNLTSHNGKEYSYGGTIPCGAKVNGDEVFVDQTINHYTVRVEASVAFDSDCKQEGEKFYKEYELEYGAKITVNGETDGAKEYTVSETPLTITLPSLPKAKDNRDGEWEALVSVSGATFTPVYKAKVIYHSTLEFEHDGSMTTEFTVDYSSSNYQLFDDVSIEGYIFLGWYTQIDGKWQRVTSLNSADYATTTVEALWTENNWFTFTAGCEEKSILFSNRKNYEYTASASVTIDKLHGAMIEGGSKIEFAFVFDNNETALSYENSSTDDSITKTENRKSSKPYNHAHVRVTITYDNGVVVIYEGNKSV